jgi:hypothetical protein
MSYFENTLINGNLVTKGINTDVNSTLFSTQAKVITMNTRNITLGGDQPLSDSGFNIINKILPIGLCYVNEFTSPNTIYFSNDAEIIFTAGNIIKIYTSIPGALNNGNYTIIDITENGVCTVSETVQDENNVIYSAFKLSQLSAPGFTETTVKTDGAVLYSDGDIIQIIGPNPESINQGVYIIGSYNIPDNIITLFNLPEVPSITDMGIKDKFIPSTVIAGYSIYKIQLSQLYSDHDSGLCSTSVTKNISDFDGSKKYDINYRGRVLTVTDSEYNMVDNSYSIAKATGSSDCTISLALTKQYYSYTFINGLSDNKVLYLKPVDSYTIVDVYNNSSVGFPLYKKGTAVTLMLDDTNWIIV